MKRGKVVVSAVHPADVSAAFMTSMLSMQFYDFTHSQSIVNGGGTIFHYSSANVSNARNAVVRRFLDETKAEWLLCLDADMQFDPDIVDRLLEHADAKRAPIVGGLCFGTEVEGLFATLYDLMQNEDGSPQMVRYKDWPEDAIFQVAATGAACLLIHRGVLEAMREKYPEPFPWFKEDVLGTAPMGEDIRFCLAAGICGFPVHVNTGVKLGHQKTQLLTYDMYAKQRAHERKAVTDDHVDA